MARPTYPAAGSASWNGPIETAINAVSDKADQALAGLASATVQRKTGSFAIDATSAGAVQEVDSTSPTTVTIAPDMPDNYVSEISQVNTGLVTLAAGSGVTLRTSPTAGLKSPGQWGSMFVRKRPSSTSVTLPTTNLSLRYNADDIIGIGATPVSSWPESSGNNHPAATQTDSTKQPTLATNSLNGHKGVSFNSTSSFLSLSGSAINVARNKGALSVFVVYSYPSALQGARTLFGLSTNEATPRARVLLQQREQTSGLTAAGGRRLDTDAASFITGATDTVGATNVLTGTYNWPNTTIGLFKNGTQLNQNTAWLGAGNTADTASSVGTIGCTISGTAEFFGGRIYEIIVYADDSVNLRKNVHSYIQNTYGIAVSDYSGLANEYVVLGGVA